MTPDSTIAGPGEQTAPSDRTVATNSSTPAISSAQGLTAIPDPAVHRQLWVLRRLIWTAYIVLMIGLIAAAPALWRDWRRNARHWRAAALLNSMGGSVDWVRNPNSWWESGTSSVQLTGRKIHGQVTDDDLALLRDLIHVNALDVTNCGNLSDRGLAVLADLPDLEVLDLGQIERAGPPITGRTVDLVNNLTRLKSLALASSTITDEKIARLTRLKDLTILDLEGTAITDATLRTLKQNFPRLETVMLEGTAVSKEGLVALRRTMPTLQIVQEMYDENTLFPGAATPPPRP